MRIGIDARLWNETGVGRYTRNLVDELQKLDANNEYILFVLQKDADNIKEVIANKNWKVVHANIRWHSLSEQVVFSRVLNTENLNLMHFPYFSIPLNYNAPYVITIHDLILHHFPSGQASTLPSPLYWIKLFGYKFVLNTAVKKAQKIITVSQTTKKEIINHFTIPEEKLVVTYEGVDPKITGSRSANRLILEDYFLYVGNAYPHKNLHRLLSAYEKFINDHSTQKVPKLVFVGKKDYFYQKIINSINSGITTQVEFIFNPTDEILHDLYVHAKALVMPSLMEGFGLPLVEAMANNCLILASDIPICREICENAAVYFNPYKVDDIAKKINMVYSNPSQQFKEQTQYGRKRVKDFSWKTMAKKTLDVYNLCL